MIVSGRPMQGIVIGQELQAPPRLSTLCNGTFVTSTSEAIAKCAAQIGSIQFGGSVAYYSLQPKISRRVVKPAFDRMQSWPTDAPASQ